MPSTSYTSFNVLSGLVSAVAIVPVPPSTVSLRFTFSRSTVPVVASISPPLMLPVRSSVPTAASTTVPLPWVPSPSCTSFNVLSVLPVAVAIVPVPPSTDSLRFTFSRSTVPVVASISPPLMLPVRSSVPTAASPTVPLPWVPLPSLTSCSVLSVLPVAVAIVPVPPSTDSLRFTFSRSTVPVVASISPPLTLPVRSSVPTAAVTSVPLPWVPLPSFMSCSVRWVLRFAVAIVPVPPSTDSLRFTFSRSTVPVVASISPPLMLPVRSSVPTAASPTVPLPWVPLPSLTSCSVLSVLPVAVAIVPVPPSTDSLRFTFSRSTVPVVASISPPLTFPVRSSVPTAAVTTVPLPWVPLPSLTSCSVLSVLLVAVAIVPVPPSTDSLRFTFSRSTVPVVASISPPLMLPVRSSVPTAASTTVPLPWVPSPSCTSFNVLSVLSVAVAIVPVPPSTDSLRFTSSGPTVPVVASISPPLTLPVRSSVPTAAVTSVPLPWAPLPSLTSCSVLSVLPVAVAIVPVPPSTDSLRFTFSRSTVPVVASISPPLMLPVRSSVPTAAVSSVPLPWAPLPSLTSCSVLSVLPVAVAIVPVPPSTDSLRFTFSRSTVPVVASISPPLMLPVRSSVPTAASTTVPLPWVPSPSLTSCSVLSVLPVAVAIVPV